MIEREKVGTEVNFRKNISFYEIFRKICFC